MASGRQLYSIFTGARRFNPAIGQEEGQPLTNPVYGKKGTQKQYVQDRRGPFIGRYVYRGCSPEQMKELYATGTMTPSNPHPDRRDRCPDRQVRVRRAREGR